MCKLTLSPFLTSPLFFQIEAPTSKLSRIKCIYIALFTSKIRVFFYKSKSWNRHTDPVLYTVALQATFENMNFQFRPWTAFFLTANLYRGLMNCFFSLRSFTFHILFGILLPSSIYTFISPFLFGLLFPFFVWNFLFLFFQFFFSILSLSYFGFLPFFYFLNGLPNVYRTEHTDIQTNHFFMAKNDHALNQAENWKSLEQA